LENRVSISALDRHFARFLTSFDKAGTPGLYLAVMLLSHQVAAGDVCLDLPVWAEQRIFDESGEIFLAPELSDWQAGLTGSSVVGAPGDFRPLILDDRSRLYLYRYWEYESTLSERIRILASDSDGSVRQLPKRQVLDRLFPATSTHEPDWQKIAALMACLKPFLVITGSPGTGKTTTLTRILALLLEAQPSPTRRIALAAPTGKAAARLQEAIRTVKPLLDCSEAIKAAIPEEASTVHRLLGSVPGSVHFRHHQGHLLSADVVVVDEASMLDLPLLSKLVQAMPLKARLILSGDKNQLASVESGAVLGDLCGPSSDNCFSRGFLDDIAAYAPVWSGPIKTARVPGLQDCIVRLQKNYRFTGQSDIARLSESVSRGEGSQLLQSLKAGSYKNAGWFSLPGPHDMERELAPFILSGYRNYLEWISSAGTWQDIFSAFERFRVLCALRQGPYGVTAVNKLIEDILERAGLISQRRPHYSGHPVMIVQNNHELGLYNGDVGMILPDRERNGELTAVFPDGFGKFRRFSHQRLPDYETVYAMTVHKSQGSEFGKVLLILSDRDAAVFTRELVYTGVTRAREEVLICSDEEVFRTSVDRSITRTSGLRDALWPIHRESHG
jgi:exodeoxyribonuclease V alpha subunit